MAQPKRKQADVQAVKARYDQLRDLLHVRITEFADEHDVTFGALSLLLVDLGVASHMLEYVTTADKPSAAGLKLTLDIFGREITSFLDGSKQDADDFIGDSRELIRLARAEPEGWDPPGKS